MTATRSGSPDGQTVAAAEISSRLGVEVAR
jgi:hypothetical protein